MLEQLRAGSLSAVDVAAPVDNLVEALAGARDELVGLNTDSSDALGVPANSHIAVVPEGEGEPEETLADATGVVREMTTALVTERKRIAGFKALADEADEARGNAELEAAELRQQLEEALAAVADRAAEAGVPVAESLSDDDADVPARLSAARDTLEAMGADGIAGGGRNAN